jgi:hypothetical protein
VTIGQVAIYALGKDRFRITWPGGEREVEGTSRRALSRTNWQPERPTPRIDRSALIEFASSLAGAMCGQRLGCWALAEPTLML